jgi:CheY-like chemotaxis protein
MRGYEVIEARDATEALRLISEHKPHACVIDIGLPDMDGYELARKLRKIPEVRDSKLVAVTGYGTKADRRAFEEAGFDHHFPKPPDIEELNRALEVPSRLAAPLSAKTRHIYCPAPSPHRPALGPSLKPRVQGRVILRAGIGNGQPRNMHRAAVTGQDNRPRR